MNNYISLIVPCRNEFGTIETIIRSSISLPGVNEIIVVEGNSSDNTPELAKKTILDLTSKFPNIKFSYLTQSQSGKADAVFLGIKNAKNDIISIWDADMTVSEQEQKQLHERFLSENSCNVFLSGDRLGNREPGSMRFLNLVGNIFFTVLWRIFIYKNVSDTLCGSKIFNKKWLAKVDQRISDNDPYGDFTIIYSAVICNAKLIFIPLTYRSRTYGQTNISRWSGGINLLVLFIQILINKNYEQSPRSL
jgi:glycosyltransferase involved in cell wall biosynthesis